MNTTDLARAAGVHPLAYSEEYIGGLERLVAAAVAAEREACAKVCEGRIGGAVKADGWWSGFREAMRQCAAAIRARGQA